jgi:hypothetical protein
MPRYDRNDSSYERPGIPLKKVLIIIGLLVALIFGGIFLSSAFEVNEAPDYQIVQSVDGALDIRDNPGFYYTGFAHISTWPRARQTDWGQHKGDRNTGAEPIRVTFNDGGTATLNGSIRYRLPVDPERRIKVFKEFSGNVENVDRAVISHLINCIKVTGPVMSSTENQSARKGDFNFLVHEQLQKGLFEYKQVSSTLKDQFDQSGNPITVWATEIVKDSNGLPIIQQGSPLSDYGIEVAQFSVEETIYDDVTLKQFEAKKESFLAAEKSKAQREQEVQARLMIVEKGLREKAEIEAESNKEKARFVIEGQRKVEVAEKASQEATELKKKAITEAEQEREVAKLRLETERLNAEATQVKATAEEQKIQKAGAITEKERVLAQILANRDIEVADKLARIATPSVIINGGGSASTTDSVQNNLLNIMLLQQLGVIPKGSLTQLSK